MTPLYCSLKKLGKTFRLQKELLKTEMNYDEVDGDNYKDKINARLRYVKNDVLCTAFSYARYIKAMEEITGFSMKDCLSLPGLGLKNFNSLRTKQDEPKTTVTRHGLFDKLRMEDEFVVLTNIIIQKVVTILCNLYQKNYL